MPDFKNLNFNLVLIAGTALLGYLVVRKFGSLGDFLNRQPADVNPTSPLSADRRKVMADRVKLTVWNPYGRLIQKHVVNQLDRAFVAATILRESNGRETVVSEKLAIGLMQLTPIAVDDVNQNFGTKFIWAQGKIAEINIAIGAKFLELQKRRMKGFEPALFNVSRAWLCGAEGAKREPNCGASYASDVVDHATAFFDFYRSII